MGRERQDIEPPHAFLTLTEGVRAGMEFVALGGLSPWLLGHAPRGDGHPVLVLPGFMADDSSTLILRTFLEKLGYQTYGWGLGENLGPANFDTEEELGIRLTEILQKHQEPVSLVGQSLGGVYAREIAKAQPDIIRQVITLGSPLRGLGGSAKQVEEMFMQMNATSAQAVSMTADMLKRNPDVPTTSIYSQWDGVVAWENSLQDHQHGIENVHVYSSHIGMGLNPSVLYVVADRLAQDKDAWQPFETAFPLSAMFP